VPSTCAIAARVGEARPLVTETSSGDNRSTNPLFLYASPKGPCKIFHRTAIRCSYSEPVPRGGPRLTQSPNVNYLSRSPKPPRLTQTNFSFAGLRCRRGEPAASECLSGNQPDRAHGFHRAQCRPEGGRGTGRHPQCRQFCPVHQRRHSGAVCHRFGRQSGVEERKRKVSGRPRGSCCRDHEKDHGYDTGGFVTVSG
jgi:hypothetical protein